jgi:hypothetical protein
VELRKKDPDEYLKRLRANVLRDSATRSHLFKIMGDSGCSKKSA